MTLKALKPRPEALLGSHNSLMARYRHYENSKERGATLFITTTVLDFVHAFRREEPRNAMVRFIARECQLSRAALYGYVVMPHHVHLVVRLQESMNGPEFMKVFKRESGEKMVRLLTTDELKEFDQQRGLNGNTFWQYSFRSKVIEEEPMFWQKMRYMHLNPVRAGYVSTPEEYRWSSASLFAAGKWNWQKGIEAMDVEESLGTRREEIEGLTLECPEA